LPAEGAAPHPQKNQQQNLWVSLADHQKMCYSALVLAMIFSMGEPLPYHHYGKSSLCVRLSWSWDTWGMELLWGQLGAMSAR